MKNLTLLILNSLLCGFVLNINAQNFIKIDASFYSEVLDEVKSINIYLPGDYYVDSLQQYATIYYLHGGSADENEGNTNAHWYYSQHIQDTTISSPPAIFVCPNGACLPYGGSMYLNSDLYGNYEDYIMQDVIGFVENNFRARSDKNFRMITGISMGGYGSASLSSKYPEQFRACVPMSGGFSTPDTVLNNFRTKCYQEQGTYNLTYTSTSGYFTAVLFTFCGAYSPNMAIEPYHIEIPFDTLGNFQDTVLSKWTQHEIVRRVKDLPDENELSWFLICGTQDDLAFFPTYEDFADSLDFYDIGYDTSYFEGGHEIDLESWIAAVHWMDSIIDLSYQFDTIPGISVYSQVVDNFNVYPNPVSDQITISYQLKESGTAQVSIFSINGQLIETLSNEFKPAGEYRFVQNISDYQPGVYFCQVQIGNEMVTKKIIKAK